MNDMMYFFYIQNGSVLDYFLCGPICHAPSKNSKKLLVHAKKWLSSQHPIKWQIVVFTVQFLFSFLSLGASCFQPLC